MTALKAHQVQRYLVHPDLAQGIFLAYGTDPGLVREVGQGLARLFAREHPEDIIVFDQSELDADPGRLAMEARTPSLFGGRPVIRVRAATKALVPALDDIKDDPDGAVIVLEAGNLTPRDPLRLLAEQASLARALPCYPDDDRALTDLIRESFSKEGVALDPEVVPTLRQILGNDREVTRREIEKLVAFSASSKRLGVDDVLTLCADNAALVLDEIVDTAGTAHAARLDAALARALLAAVAPQQILSVALGHFQRLRQWRIRLDAGDDARSILAAARPKPHFSRTSDLERQIRTWSDPALAVATARIYSAIAESRHAPMLAQPILHRTMLAICRMAAEN